MDEIEEKMDWNDYITNNVIVYEVIELFYDLKIDNIGDIVRIPETRSEGSQMEFCYECKICDSNIESQELLREHFRIHHLKL